MSRVARNNSSLPVLHGQPHNLISCEPLYSRVFWMPRGQEDWIVSSTASTIVRGKEMSRMRSDLDIIRDAKAAEVAGV